MDRQPFDRALEFFRYARGAAWAAQAASLATGILFVALLVLLALFADLTFNRGEIPALTQLPPADRAAFLQRIHLPEDPEERKLAVQANVELYQQFRWPNARLQDLVAAGDLDSLSPHDRELRQAMFWMIDLPGYLREHVSPAAAEKMQQALHDNLKRFGPEIAFNQDLTDFGLLGLVVRTRDSYRRWLVHPLARWEPWTWQSGNQTYMLGLFAVAAAIALLRAVGFFAAHTLAARATLQAVTRLRRAVYLQTYRLGTLAFHALGPTEAVGISTRQLESVHEGLYLWLTSYFREPTKFALLCLFALLVNFWLALAFVLFAGLVWLIGGQIASHFRTEVRIASQAAADQLALTQESLMLMRLVKAYLMEPFNQNRFEKQLAAYAGAQERRYRAEAIYRPTFTFLGMLAVLSMLYLTGHVVLNGHLGIASAVAMATALVSLYWPASHWLETRRTLRRSRTAAGALFDFLDRGGSVGQAAEAEFLPGLSRVLEFDKVTLKEPGTGRNLLRSVSLSVRAGQKVAIVGPDEIEKHALVYLMVRFLDPTQGEIRIDRKNIRWVTLDSLRVQVALILQHNLVFNDTVAHNIGCGDSSFNLARIIEAAKLAHAHQFISKLPKGYETVVGEMGHTLKPGEMFRIALARAILRDPALFVIEEPSSQLDDDTKALIDDTLQRILPGRTAIFLPHRLSTIRNCDRIFFLYEGRIAEQGEHRELLQKSDLYRHLQYLEFNEFAGLTLPAPTTPPDVKL